MFINNCKYCKWIYIEQTTLNVHYREHFEKNYVGFYRIKMSINIALEFTMCCHQSN